MKQTSQTQAIQYFVTSIINDYIRDQRNNDANISLIDLYKRAQEYIGTHYNVQITSISDVFPDETIKTIGIASIRQNSDEYYIEQSQRINNGMNTGYGDIKPHNVKQKKQEMIDKIKNI